MASYEHLRGELELAAAAASDEVVTALRRRLGEQVPDDYLTFLSMHDGAEGAAGVIAPAAEVGRAADLYPGLDHLHDFVIFGSDGGGEAFAFDPHGLAVGIPWIGGSEDAKPQGTFTQFLSRLVDERLFEPLP